MNSNKDSKESKEVEEEVEEVEDKALQEDSVEVKGFSVKFKGMYTTTLIVLALVAMVWILQACTSTSHYTLNSTQIQNVNTEGTTASETVGEGKGEVSVKSTTIKSTTKSVNQIKLL